MGRARRGWFSATRQLWGGYQSRCYGAIASWQIMLCVLAVSLRSVAQMLRADAIIREPGLELSEEEWTKLLSDVSAMRVHGHARATGGGRGGPHWWPRSGRHGWPTYESPLVVTRQSPRPLT